MNYGRAAGHGELPWHVSVGVRQNRGPAFTAFEGHQGAGTIVGARWVVTAAHCLSAVSDLLTPDGWLTPTGEVRLAVVSGTDLNAPAQEVDVAFALVHPRFDPQSLAYDAALLRLSHGIEAAIELCEDDLAPGECGTVTGWHGTNGTFAKASLLAWARMHVAADDVCARQTCGSLRGRPDLMFAAGGNDARCPAFPRAAVRKGDSGSGFVVTRAGKPRLSGIVSWSASALGDPDAPLVFTRTFPITDWVARETRRN